MISDVEMSIFDVPVGGIVSCKGGGIDLLSH